jgi:small GTP-binding protein
MLSPETSVGLKLVVLGSLSVGKTSVIQRYCSDVFPENQYPTTGAGFFSREVKIDGTLVNIELWDTAGEERFRSVTPKFMRGANGCVLVFDRQNLTSFRDLDAYLTLFCDTVDVTMFSVMPVLLLANKCDIPQSEVPESLVEDWKKAHNIQFSFNASAKTGHNIETSFAEFISCLLLPENFAVMPSLPSSEPQENIKKSWCC